MSPRTDEQQDMTRRSRSVSESPVWIALWTLFMAQLVWFEGNKLEDKGFSWVPVVFIALAGLSAGLSVSRLPYVHRSLLGRRTPKV